MKTNFSYAKKSYTSPNTEGIKLTKEPDMFTLDDDPLRPRGIMSCGHAVLPSSLTIFIFSELSKGKSQICCPYISLENTQSKCGMKWSYTELRKMALLNDIEKQEIELKLSLNKLNRQSNTVECPYCHNLIIKKNPKSNKIKCKNCTKKKGRPDFCGLCLKTWTGISDQYCGNFECQIDYRLPILKYAELMHIKDAEVPSIRGCPKCGILIEMNSYPNYCKTVNCYCKFKFCFICTGYCSQNSKIFPCFEREINPYDKQQGMKIICQKKELQTELPVQDVEKNCKNQEVYINEL